MPETKAALGAEPPGYPGTPRWVKALGVILGLLALLVVVLLFADGGSHGPFRHLPSAEAVGEAPTSRVVE